MLGDKRNSERITNLIKKPVLRGYFHQEAFFISVGACAMLIANSTHVIAYFASSIYSFGLLFMFGVSAIYHRPHWEPKPRAFLKRLDHSAIFILIAATSTPLCLLALSQSSGKAFLLLIWVVAFIGVLQSIFWVSAPKYLTAIFYVGMGWLALPYLSEIHSSLGFAQLLLLIIGGVFYSVGAIFYALKWPVRSARIFGYHELFHIFTIVAATLHFIVIYQIIK